MDANAEELLGHMATRTGFDLSHDDIAATQLAAINERFHAYVGTIKLLEQRAKDAGITDIQSLQDVVPLLLPHTAFKSYPESFLTSKRWDRLTRWLGTISTQPTDSINLEGVEDVDGWIAACSEASHHVSCTSGTTGKPAMLPATQADLDFAAQEGVEAVQWGSHIRAGDRRTVISYGATAHTRRNMTTGGALIGAFADVAKLAAPSAGPAITIGSITRMIGLRKAIGDGMAQPEDIAEFERESAARQAALDVSLDETVERIIANRGDRLLFLAMWGPLYQLAVAVRERGYSAKDFHPENGSFLGGGLKGAQVPENYREFIFETFNLTADYTYQMYGMQETQTSMPRCSKGGRYHVPAWMVCLPLDKAGETLLPATDGPIIGRAAFFDLSITGRWGGVISGDQIEIDYSPCACGSRSPSIADTIARYSDLEGDDKIACSGTVDAYVRGLA